MEAAIKTRTVDLYAIKAASESVMRAYACWIWPCVEITGGLQSPGIHSWTWPTGDSRTKASGGYGHGITGQPEDQSYPAAKTYLVHKTFLMSVAAKYLSLSLRPATNDVYPIVWHVSTNY